MQSIGNFILGKAVNQVCNLLGGGLGKAKAMVAEKSLGAVVHVLCGNDFFPTNMLTGGIKFILTKALLLQQL